MPLQIHRDEMDAVFNEPIAEIQPGIENNVRNHTLSFVNTHFRITIRKARSSLGFEILAESLSLRERRENVVNDKSFESSVSTLLRRHRSPARNNECLSLAASAAKKVTTIFHR